MAPIGVSSWFRPFTESQIKVGSTKSAPQAAVGVPNATSHGCSSATKNTHALPPTVHCVLPFSCFADARPSPHVVGNIGVGDEGMDDVFANDNCDDESSEGERMCITKHVSFCSCHFCSSDCENAVSLAGYEEEDDVEDLPDDGLDAGVVPIFDLNL